MLKKLLLAIILCTSIVGCKDPKAEKPEETPITEQETTQENEKNESEASSEPTENPNETVPESAPPAEGVTVDEDASYEFEEDTDYIIQ